MSNISVFKDNLSWIRSISLEKFESQQLILQDFLAKTLKPEDTVLTENNKESYYFLGTPHFLNQYVLENVPLIRDYSGGFPEGMATSSTPFVISRTFAEGGFDPDYTKGLGVQYVITTDSRSQLFFMAEKSLERIFSTEESFEPISFAVFKFKDPVHPYKLPSETYKNLKKFSFTSPGIYEFEFTKPQSFLNSTELGLNFHPWMKLIDENGKTYKTVQNLYGQINLAEPIENCHVLRYIYAPPKIYFVWAPLISLVLGALFIFGLGHLGLRRFF